MIELPKETLDFFDGDELRARLFYEKYSLSDENGNRLEKTPVEMWKRISRELASVEKSAEKKKKFEEEFYWLLEDFKFVPGGRILFGAGSKHKATLLNCYYLPIKDDSIEGIFTTAKEMARTYSYGGGVGIDISILRPKGSPVHNAARFSTGAVSFMELFSVTTGTIGQTGRRGALMITMDVSHPDIEDFIESKKDKKSIRYANISVKVSDDFMKAVEEDKPYLLHFKNNKVEFNREVKARDIWKRIIENALATGDPGVMFWDRMKKESPTEYDDRMAIKGTNPCLLGDTFLQTEYGLTPIAKLETRQDFVAADTKDKTNVKKVWITGTKDVYKFETSMGYFLNATTNHNVMSREGEDVNPTEKLIIDNLSVDHYITLSGLADLTGLSSSTLSKNISVLSKKSLIKISKDKHQKYLIKLAPTAGRINSFYWNEIGNLKLGDKLLMSIKEGVFPKNYLLMPQFEQVNDTKGHRRNVFHFPETINEDVGALLGWIVTDGTSIPYKGERSRLLDSEKSIKIISVNDDEDRDIRNLIKSVFGVEPKGGKLRKTNKAKDWKVFGQNLDGFIRQFGLDRYHDNIEVPEQILSSPKSVVASFIKRAFQGNGSCVYDRVTIDSISEKFIFTLQQLLLKFGIISSVKTTKRNAPRKNIYTLNITDLKSLERFREEINFVSKDKKGALDSLILRMKKELGRGNTQFSSKYRWVDDTHIEVKLIGKSYLGKFPVYDCETSTHSFVANGFVVHNCSEQPLENYGACDLGALNLSYFVKNRFEKNAEVDWDALDRTIRLGVRFLDNVLDYSYDRHALKEQADETVYARRIGLGFMGLADMLIGMGLKYDSEESIKFVDSLMKRIKETAYDESVNLAVEKGSFPAFVAEKHVSRDFVSRLDKKIVDRIKKEGLRNACILTVAPTGSISTMAGVSGGIEPIFALSYTRRSESLSEGSFDVLDPFVKEYMERFGIKDIKDLPDIFVTAHKIDPMLRVKMQATIQKHIDSSISSTVNLQSSAGYEVVDKIYREAWKLGCKSITVYREGSKEDILKAKDEDNDSLNKVEEKKLSSANKLNRPYILRGTTMKLPIAEGSLYITMNKDDDHIEEVFISLGRSGESEKAYTEAIGRLISIYLQEGGDVDRIIKTLKGIKGGSSIWFNGMQIFSVPDAISKALEMEEKGIDINKAGNLHTVINPEKSKNEGFSVCPACGQKTLVFENGCYICKNCGYTKCE